MYQLGGGQQGGGGLWNAYTFSNDANDVCGVSSPLRIDKSRMVRSGSKYHAGVVCSATRNQALQDSVELIDVPEGGENVVRGPPPRFGLGVLQEGGVLRSARAEPRCPPPPPAYITALQCVPVNPDSKSVGLTTMPFISLEWAESLDSKLVPERYYLNGPRLEFLTKAISHDSWPGWLRPV